MVSGVYEPAVARLGQHAKDVHLILEFARQSGAQVGGWTAGSRLRFPCPKFTRNSWTIWCATAGQTWTMPRSSRRTTPGLPASISSSEFSIPHVDEARQFPTPESARKGGTTSGQRVCEQRIELICRLRRKARQPARFRLLTKAKSFRCRKSVDFITDTNAALPDPNTARFAVIPHGSRKRKSGWPRADQHWRSRRPNSRGISWPQTPG